MKHFGSRILMMLSLPLVLLTVGGCASKAGLITSIEDLSTESKKEGWWKVPQYRVVSVPGLLPFGDVGGLYFYKPKRQPASVIGLSPGQTFVLVTKIEAECDEACLIPIRDSLTKLRTQALSLIQDRVDLTRSLNAEKPTGDATRQEYEKAHEDAKAAYKKSRDEFDKSYEKVVSDLKSNGIMIYRWATDAKKSGSIGLGSIFGGSSKRNEQYNGFALLSGLRLATLFIGEDIREAWPKLNKDSRYHNRFELTTHVMQAKYIMYGAEADLETLVDMKLKASYDQLANLPETIKHLDRIEINAVLSKLSNLSNMGMVGKAKRTTMQVDWTQKGLEKRLSLDDWHTFYSVESDLTDLIDLSTPVGADKPR